MNLKSVDKAGRWRIRNDELPTQRQGDCQRQTLPDHLGIGQSTAFQLDTDLSYIESRYQPACDLSVLTHIEQQEPRLVVTLGLQGQSRFVDKRGREILFKEGFTSITAFNASVGERHYQAGAASNQLRLSMSQTWLRRYFGEQADQFFQQSGVRLLSCKPISGLAMTASRQLINRRVEPPAARLFMHAQALSILTAEIGHLWRDSSEIPVTLNPKDQALAQAARQILLKEFKRPPSVVELARRVGTNQCKLKQLFHHFFNTTPYGMLLEIRMAEARQLLESGRSPVSAVAQQVGYQHASNFSTAFNKHFGVAPRTLGRQD